MAERNLRKTKLGIDYNRKCRKESETSVIW
jgi:hypothetical protein